MSSFLLRPAVRWRQVVFPYGLDVFATKHAGWQKGDHEYRHAGNAGQEDWKVRILFLVCLHSKVERDQHRSHGDDFGES